MFRFRFTSRFYTIALFFFLLSAAGTVLSVTFDDSGNDTLFLSNTSQF